MRILIPIVEYAFYPMNHRHPARRRTSSSTSQRLNSRSGGASEFPPAFGLTAESTRDTAGSPETGSGNRKRDASPAEIPDHHIFMEYVAHHLNYNPSAIFEPKHAEVIQNAGYDPGKTLLRRGEKGFLGIVMMPSEGRSDLLPIFSIRGTVPGLGNENRGTLSTDFDLAQVGDSQYKRNLDLIKEMINEAGGRVNITGHSLGGAMAQIITANHIYNIAELVSFQAPGVSFGTRELFEESDAAPKPEVTHHISNNDIVDDAGRGHLPGSTYEHHLRSFINPLSSHSAFVFGTDAFEERRNQIGLTDGLMEQMDRKIYKGDPGITHYDEHPTDLRRVVAEGGRTVGSILSLPLRIIGDFLRMKVDENSR